jgi:hypothetical protein
VEDDHVDRPGVEAQQCVKLTGTNRSIGLIVLMIHVRGSSIDRKDLWSSDKLRIADPAWVSAFAGMPRRRSALAGLNAEAPGPKVRKRDCAPALMRGTAKRAHARAGA